MKPMPQDGYLSYQGNRCPACHSPEISGDAIVVDSGTAQQGMTCADCNATWVDNYALTGYLDLETDQCGG